MKTRLHVSHLSPLFPAALQLVQNDKYELTFQDRMAKNEQELTDTIRNADILYLGGDDYYSENVLKQAKNLKLISFGGTGYDSYIDMDAATGRGIAVTSTPGANAESVAEHKLQFINHAIYSMLAARAGTAIPNMRGSNTNPAGQEPVIDWPLVGTSRCSFNGPIKIGLIGFGNIHKKLYEELKKNGNYQIHFWNRTKIDNPDYRDLDTILKESHLLSISITANKETQGFLDTEKFKKIEHGNNMFGLINSCRHNLVDEQALIKFLNGYWTRTYHVDQEIELKGIKQMPNCPQKVVTTPVIGCRTKKAWNKTDRMAFQNIVDFVDTGTSKLIVNPEYKSAKSLQSAEKAIVDAGRKKLVAGK